MNSEILINFFIVETNATEALIFDTRASIYSVKQTVSLTFKLASTNLKLTHNDKEMLDNQSISAYGVQNDDIVMVEIKPSTAIPNNLLSAFDLAMKSAQPKTNNSILSAFDQAMKQVDPNAVLKSRVESILNSNLKQIKELRNDPDQLNNLLKNDETLAVALLSEDDETLKTILRERIMKQEKEAQKEKDEYNQLLRSNSNDPEAQAKIEVYLKKQRCEENRQLALEQIPQTFVPVTMLYLPLEINNSKFIALFDTGAQMTCMSMALCKACGLDYMLDERSKGEARGVGTSKILGVIHAAQINVGGM